MAADKDAPFSFEDAFGTCGENGAEGSDKKRPGGGIDGSDQKRFRSVECTLEAIKKKNQQHHGMGAGISFFDVPVRKLPLTMRDDCQLEIVEAPGLNPSNTGNEESRAYFADNWDTFDAVILVVDAQERVDHADQIENMNFIRSLLEKKNIPCFVLCNKV